MELRVFTLILVQLQELLMWLFQEKDFKMIKGQLLGADSEVQRILQL